MFVGLLEVGLFRNISLHLIRKRKSVYGPENLIISQMTI